MLDAKYEDIEKYSLSEIAENIIKTRNGQVDITPGYDGVYGKIKILREYKNFKKQQKNLL